MQQAVNKSYEKVRSKVERIVYYNNTSKWGVLSLKNTIKDALGYEDNSSKRFEDQEIWDGKAGESISRKIKEYKECFPTMVESLETYIKFLRETLDNYKRAEETLNKSIESNAEELNVN